MSAGTPQLFMILLGCRPAGRLTEQHDVFFGVGSSLHSLIPSIRSFWKEAGRGLHIDAWRAVQRVGDYSVSIGKKRSVPQKERLYFINLGGYRKNEFDEFHEKILVVAQDQAEAVKLAKQSHFFIHTGTKGAPSHIDDKYELEADDVCDVSTVLQRSGRNDLSIVLKRSSSIKADGIHLGYLPLSRIGKEL
jgi:hypothetical protein